MLTYGQWIENKFVSSKDDAIIEVENPTTGKIIGKVPAGCTADAKVALSAAKKAQVSWAKTPVNIRAKLLKDLATIIRENRESLIETLISEQSKVKGLAAVEIDVTATYLEYYAGLAYSFEGEILQSDNVGENIYVHKAPIGVSVGIVPWNFPFFVMARKVAPALLAGCSVVVKSSELTPLTSFKFMDFVSEALEAGKIDIPSGLIALVTGHGSIIGEALCQSPIPDIISMTGSVATGQSIMRNAATNMTKVSLELGGKAPCIVMGDADLDQAVDAIAASRTIFSGQVCNCAERAYVHSSVYDSFIEKLAIKMSSTKYGDPNDEDSEYGSLISANHRTKVEGMVQRAIESGATVLCGGKSANDRDGYFFEPTVLVDVKQDSEIMQKEIFGPVLPVMKFDTFDEALDMANDSEYGLASSLFTNDYRLIERARTELLFGETYINRFHFEAIQGFHAGWRKSGIGGADGKHGLMEYLSTKVVYVQT